MVLPLLPIALALTAGGIGANYLGAKKAENAQQDTMAAERIRQGRFDKEADATTTKSRKRFENFDDQQVDKADELADLFLAGAGQAPPALDAPTDTVTVQRTADEKADRRQFTDQQGRARGKMLSFGDLYGDIGVGQARDMTTLSGIGGMRRGSQGVLPAELDAASQEGGGLRMAGDIMGGLGSIASMGALSGASLPALFGKGAAASAAAGAAGAAKPAALGAGSLFSLFG